MLHSGDWYDTWAVDLYARVEGIILAVETRPVREIRDPGGFRVAMVGDSTMRMQTDGLFALISSMRTSDGKLRCSCTTYREPCLCFNSGEGSNDTIVLRIDYYKEADHCFATKVEADFVYFGCGLHILHHHPSRPVSEVRLQRWTQYEKNLENAVKAYRSSVKPRSTYLGEAFMSTHSMLLEKLEDPMHGDILQFMQRDSLTLAACYSKVEEVATSLDQTELEVPAKDICTRGYFADECIVDLNKRGKAAMARLGVPVVPAYEITVNQAWATEQKDGRHYHSLVPQELAHFLGIISTALKEEKLASGY